MLANMRTWEFGLGVRLGGGQTGGRRATTLFKHVSVSCLLSKMELLSFVEQACVPSPLLA